MGQALAFLVPRAAIYHVTRADLSSGGSNVSHTLSHFERPPRKRGRVREHESLSKTVAENELVEGYNRCRSSGRVIFVIELAHEFDVHEQ